MARLAGVDLPKRKRIDIALTYIFGIGRASAKVILGKAEVEGSVKTDDLTEGDVQKIRRVIDDEYTVEGDLRRDLQMSVKRLMDLGCYRGLRHRKGLPCRGQRTHTNARTLKGPRRILGRKK